MKFIYPTLLLLSLFFCAAVFSQYAQKTFRYELTALTDNDDYTWKYTDRYYSNGLFLRFAMALKDAEEKKSNGFKKILSLELGQQMINSYRNDIVYYKQLDRPFAGLLFAKATVTKVFTNENVLQWGVQAGIMGPSAKGKEVQTNWHSFFNIRRVYGWETQLNDEAFINLSASYHHHLIKKQKDKPWYDAFAFASATAGNNLSNATVGLQFKLGAFEKAYQSVAWGTLLQKSKQVPSYRRNHEVYFYFEPQLTLQAYNAIIQGGMFLKGNEKGFYHTDINPLVFQYRYGILYAQNHWTVQLGYTFKTREAENQIAIENFGTIRLSYRFR